MCTLGAQNVNGWTQEKMDGFCAHVSYTFCGKRRCSYILLRLGWILHLLPYSWYKATVIALVPHRFSQKRKYKTLTSAQKIMVSFCWDRRSILQFTSCFKKNSQCQYVLWYIVFFYGLFKTERGECWLVASTCSMMIFCPYYNAIFALLNSWK